MREAPTISIITATYNASHVLRYAVRSVLENEFQDWELIVVGDHCTDDTETVVAAFADDRIRFVNLPANSGQQATPNNHGVTMARGSYLCFLNHDDLFLPGHLGDMLKAAQDYPDSILLAGYADIRTVETAGEPDGDPPAPSRLILRRTGPTERSPAYDPLRWQIASSWFMPTALARQVGPWRLEHETYVTPSQDWLFRAWRGGRAIVGVPWVTVLAVCTGGRRNFFAGQHDAVHEHVFNRYVATREHDHELESLPPVSRGRPGAGVLRRAARALYEKTVCRLSIAMGVHPNTLEMRVRHGKRGGFIRQWRRGVNLDG